MQSAGALHANAWASKQTTTKIMLARPRLAWLRLQQTPLITMPAGRRLRAGSGVRPLPYLMSCSHFSELAVKQRMAVHCACSSGHIAKRPPPFSFFVSRSEFARIFPTIKLALTTHCSQQFLIHSASTLPSLDFRCCLPLSALSIPDAVFRLVIRHGCSCWGPATRATPSWSLSQHLTPRC